MGLICDLCRKPLIEGKDKWIEGNDGNDICIDCVKVCVEIINDPNTKKLTYLNEYKERKEMENERKK